MNSPLAVIPQATHETAASSAAAQSKALVEARYTVALARPRDMDLAREKLLKECRRPSFAESVQYRKPVGKKQDDKGNWVQNYIEGPSIRFAEAAIRCMGNIVVQETTTYDDAEKRIIEVSVTDLESNTCFPSSITIDKTIERKRKKEGDEVIRERTNSYGEKVFVLRATEDELLNKKNALLSKAIRTNGLRLVPGDLIDECMAVALETTKKQDAQDPDAARKKVFDAFAALNVTASDLKSYVGADLAKLSPAELAELRALHAAIKDGETTWRAAYELKHPPADKPTDGRFKKDQAKAETPRAPTHADAIALAKTLPDAAVLGVLESFSAHTIGDIKPEHLPDLMAALTAAKTSSNGGRP